MRLPHASFQYPLDRTFILIFLATLFVCGGGVALQSYVFQKAMFWPIWIYPILGLLTALLVAYDFRHGILPDILTVFLAGMFFLLALSEADQMGWAVLGGLIGFLFFWCVRRVTHSLTGRVGLGLGDVKMLGAIGLGVGPFALSPLILCAASLGIAFVGIRHVRAKTETAMTGQVSVAFGPFLLLGMWVSQVFPNTFFVMRSEIFSVLAAGVWPISL